MGEVTNEDIGKRLAEFIRQKFPLAGGQDLAGDTSLLDSGIVDSIGVLDLVTFIEEQFAIVADDDDLVAENFESIDALVSFVRERQ